MVVGEWLNNTQFVVVKATLVAMCLVPTKKPRANKSSSSLQRLRFETMAGDVVAINSFNKNTTTAQQLYAFVREHQDQEDHEEDHGKRSSTAEKLFSLCYGTFEIPNTDDTLLTDFLTPQHDNEADISSSVTVLTVVFFSTPRYHEFVPLITLEKNRIFEDEREELWDLAVSSDDGTVLVATSKAKVKLLSAENGRVLQTFAGHPDSEVQLVAFRPDGKTAISISTEASVKVWSLKSGKCLSTVPLVDHDSVTDVSLIPGRSYALCPRQYHLDLVSLESGNTVKTFPSDDAHAMSARISPNGETFVAGYINRLLKLWSIDSGACLRTFFCDDPMTLDVVFNLDGSVIAATSATGIVTLLSAEDFSFLKEFPALDERRDVERVVFSPCGNFMLAAATGKCYSVVQLWSIESGECLKTFPRQACDLVCPLFGRSGRRIYIWDEEGTITIYGTKR